MILYKSRLQEEETTTDPACSIYFVCCCVGTTGVASCGGTIHSHDARWQMHHGCELCRRDVYVA